MPRVGRLVVIEGLDGAGKNTLTLNPHVIPAYIFRIRRRVRTERDFEYFL